MAGVQVNAALFLLVVQGNMATVRTTRVKDLEKDKNTIVETDGGWHVFPVRDETVRYGHTIHHTKHVVHRPMDEQAS